MLSVLLLPASPSSYAVTMKIRAMARRKFLNHAIARGVGLNLRASSNVIAKLEHGAWRRFSGYRRAKSRGPSLQKSMDLSARSLTVRLDIRHKIKKRKAKQHVGYRDEYPRRFLCRRLLCFSTGSGRYIYTACHMHEKSPNGSLSGGRRVLVFQK